MCVNVCGCVRADAGNSKGFLEDGLAGKLGLYRHGYQPGGGGQGEFVIQEITKCVCMCMCVGEAGLRRISENYFMHCSNLVTVNHAASQ